MRSLAKLVSVALLFTWFAVTPSAMAGQDGNATSSQKATGQKSGTENSGGQKQQKNSAPEMAPATRSGPRIAPENERPIARPPRSSAPRPRMDCVGAVNTTDCLSSVPPGSQSEQSGDEQQGSNGSSAADSGGDLLQSIPPPHSGEDSGEGVSSSRATKGNLGPGPAPDVDELHPFDPHKAAKDIEVGEFYLKRGNYKAAISRFREALQWKPKDALATFRLAEALEKDNQLPEAANQYSLYLDILPNGEYAADARAALERIEGAQQASVPGK